MTLFPGQSSCTLPSLYTVPYCVFDTKADRQMIHSVIRGIKLKVVVISASSITVRPRYLAL